MVFAPCQTQRTSVENKPVRARQERASTTVQEPCCTANPFVNPTGCEAGKGLSTWRQRAGRLSWIQATGRQNVMLVVRSEAKNRGSQTPNRDWLWQAGKIMKTTSKARPHTKQKKRRDRKIQTRPAVGQVYDYTSRDLGNEILSAFNAEFARTICARSCLSCPISDST